MGDFADSRCGSGERDPRKRVRYSHGMVLGEDDLAQEQAYLRARDHEAVRALHGFGTVAGLAVTWDTETGQLQVSPGLAVDPVGRFVCVPGAQCADPAAWLTAHRADLQQVETSLPGPVSLYVVLCHRECETDTVPVPAESCRSAEESLAASRILDSFELRLLLAPPVEAGETAGGALARAVDRILATLASLPEDSLVDVDPVRRELIAWATRARPELATAACLQPPADNCGRRADDVSTAVLLARVDVEVDLGGDGTTVVLTARPDVQPDERPVLLSTRFLQEWLTEVLLHPELLGPPPIEDHNALLNLAVGDVHTQYLPVDGHRPLEADLDAGGHALGRLAASTEPHHAVRAAEVFTGDLARGPGGGARIEQLQGTPLRTSAGGGPTTGDVLTFDGTQWVPAPIETGRPPAPAQPARPLVTIEPVGRARGGDRDSRSVFLLWFHPDTLVGEVALADTAGSALTYETQLFIRAERCTEGGPPSLDLVTGVRIAQLSCSTFRIDVLDNDVPLLRFVLVLSEIGVVVDGVRTTLLEHSLDRGLAWLGGEGKTVTTFVVDPSVLEQTFPGFQDVTDRPLLPGGSRFTLGRVQS
ncbi:hypothetical protein SAMN05660359_03898 [Geodermatophilus obscurus]|uniref:Uncharacterized protein n=1 Tax=Geodermatophilus obscurus TaxID=1861 RepID=A0A1I5HPB9_9ACTN|nr:hypothetical protein [Geodermatophilus obscurus]SFO50165.1 hypothetical protein SAMN05660359_03898 [Geodermatophilus obscurus]